MEDEELGLQKKKKPKTQEEMDAERERRLKAQALEKSYKETAQREGESMSGIAGGLWEKVKEGASKLKDAFTEPDIYSDTAKKKEAARLSDRGLGVPKTRTDAEDVAYNRAHPETEMGRLQLKQDKEDQETLKRIEYRKRMNKRRKPGQPGDPEPYEGE